MSSDISKLSLYATVSPPLSMSKWSTYAITSLPLRMSNVKVYAVCTSLPVATDRRVLTIY